MNSNKITNLATPTTGTDGATKGYADSALAAATLGGDTIMNLTDNTSKLVAN